jgi:glycosyltransferase involved in cell wall biosynthesis
LRVAHVVKGLGPGGAERLIVNQVRTGDVASFNYRVLRLIDHKDHLVGDLHALGVETPLVGSGPSWPLRLRNMLRVDPVDVVHVHSPLVAVVVRMLHRVGGVPGAVVTTEHNRWPRHHRATRLLNRLTVGLDDATFAVSEDVRLSMSSSAQARTTTLRHGIPLEEVQAAAAHRDRIRTELGLGKVVVGIVANFRPEKAYDVFLDAAESALASSDLLEFVVVGQGPGEDAFRSAVSARGLGNSVHVLGYRSDAREVMSAFDVFTLTSRHEGLPVSLMEAFALGLPVVSTRAGGIPEEVTDGSQGILVDIDAVDQIAAAWVRLAENPDERSQMAQAARTSAVAFDAASSTSEIESLYRRLITGSG